MSGRVSMDFSDYSSIPAINWSSLKYMADSPRMFRYRLTHPEPRKPSYEMGSAVHCAILEPEKFDERYGVFDGIRRGKEWEAWKAENPGKEGLKPAKLDQVQWVADAVMEHRVARTLLRGGLAEEVITWRDERTGLLLKCRADYLRPDLVIDLKGTRDATPARFKSDALRYGHYGQVAMYHDGAIAERRIDGKACPVIIAARTGADFDVAVFQLTPNDLERGRALYRGFLQRLIECTEADYWPGVAPELVPLDMPDWGGNKLTTDEPTTEDF